MLFIFQEFTTCTRVVCLSSFFPSIIVIGKKLSDLERVTSLKVYNWFANRRKEIKRRANIGNVSESLLSRFSTLTCSGEIKITQDCLTENTGGSDNRNVGQFFKKKKHFSRFFFSNTGRNWVYEIPSWMQEKWDSHKVLLEDQFLKPKQEFSLWRENHIPCTQAHLGIPDTIWNKTWKRLHWKQGKLRLLQVQNLSVPFKWEVVVVRSFYMVVSFLVSVFHWNALVFSAKTQGCLSYCHPSDPTGI